MRMYSQVSKMHQLDPVLQSLDVELENASAGDDAEQIMKQIKDRETLLMPLYLQVAHEFADLHDRSGRMKAKGVVRDVLNWKSSRAYMYWRVKRRLAEDHLRNQLTSAGIDHTVATESVESIVGPAAYGDDKAFLELLEKDGPSVEAQVGALKTKALTASIAALLTGLSDEQKKAVLAEL